MSAEDVIHLTQRPQIVTDNFRPKVYR